MPRLAVESGTILAWRFSVSDVSYGVVPESGANVDGEDADNAVDGKDADNAVDGEDAFADVAAVAGGVCVAGARSAGVAEAVGSLTLKNVPESQAIKVRNATAIIAAAHMRAINPVFFIFAAPAFIYMRLYDKFIS